MGVSRHTRRHTHTDTHAQQEHTHALQVQAGYLTCSQLAAFLTCLSQWSQLHYDLTLLAYLRCARRELTATRGQSPSRARGFRLPWCKARVLEPQPIFVYRCCRSQHPNNPTVKETNRQTNQQPAQQPKRSQQPKLGPHCSAPRSGLQLPGGLLGPGPRRQRARASWRGAARFGRPTPPEGKGHERGTHGIQPWDHGSSGDKVGHPSCLPETVLGPSFPFGQRSGWSPLLEPIQPATQSGGILRCIPCSPRMRLFQGLGRFSLRKPPCSAGPRC